ncbi:SET domain-containing protein [Seiridium cupressi]
MGKSTASVPSNWPANFPYLLQPSHANHLSKSQITALRTRPADLTTEIPSNLPRGPSALVKITPIAIPTHPANGQSGLFAARPLPPGSLILPYYGIVHSASSPHSLEHEKSDYDLWLDREAEVAVDADKAGNEARFVNDYRGVRDRPNAEFRECWDPRIGQRCMGVFVLPAGKNAAKGKGKGDGGIAKGEEICVSYGKGFWGKRKAEEETYDNSGAEGEPVE